MEKRSSLDDVQSMADAAEFISLGDALNKQLRTNMDWSLLPNVGVCGALAPCLLTQGRSFYPAFPQWLGKNSSQKKSLRQIKELKQAMGPQAYAPRRSLQGEFVPLLLEKLYRLLSRDKVADAVELLDALGISNEMMKEHLMDLCAS